ncbi:MAG: SCO family protein [Gemmatimonadaceae bacterium]
MALVLGGTLLLPACSRGEGDSLPTSGFRGVLISPPREKPDISLTDADGKPFNFRLGTAGKVTLLFFGYTHCPDVCPLHAANVAAVLKRMPFEERDAIRFVFVTTDPARDTPARLKEWLGNFDPGFIGLTGSQDEVNRMLFSLRMPPIQPDPQPTDSANYLVGHAAQVLAFGSDGLARIEYPFGIRQEDWAKDLPRLARGEIPYADSSAAAGGNIDLRAAPAAAVLLEPPLRVVAALVPRPATLSEGALYLVIRNNGREDTLVGVWSEAAKRAEIHSSQPAAGGMTHMSAVERIVVPQGGTLQLVPGAQHVMLFDIGPQPEVGQSLPIRLRFSGQGDVILAANVVKYADVERLLAGAVASIGK